MGVARAFGGRRRPDRASVGGATPTFVTHGRDEGGTGRKGGRDH